MKKLPYILLAIIAFVNISLTKAQEATTDGFTFNIEFAKKNKSVWVIPYRFADKELESISVKLIINNSQVKVFNPNLISLANNNDKTRIRACGLYYERANNDKRKYLKAKPTNKNYTYFENNSLEGFTNFQAETFKPNFFGKIKKNEVPSIKSLKKVTIKKQTTYFIDFPINKDFKEGDLYYKKVKIGSVKIN